MSGPIGGRRRCGVIAGDASGRRGWVGIKAKVVVGLVVLEASSGVGLYLVIGALEGGFSLDRTEGRNAADPDRGIIAGSLGAIEGAGAIVSAFIAVCSALG